MKDMIYRLLIVLLSGLIGFKVYGCIDRENTKDVLSANPFPPPAIDPDILHLAWKRGTIAGMNMVRNTVLTGDEIGVEAYERQYWPVDSIILQNCIKLEYGN